MAAFGNIPAPEGMQMSGDTCKNWEMFQAEFEDFSLATGGKIRGHTSRHAEKNNGK